MAIGMLKVRGPMKNEFEFKHFEPTPAVRSLINQRIARLDRQLQALADKDLFVRCVVEQVPARTLFSVSITLAVPQKTLSAKEEMHDAEAAIRSAFAEIERQVEAYKAEIRGEHWWKRVQRRRVLARQKAAAAPAGDENPQWFFALVEPHLEKVREVAGRVLRYVEARGDLPPHTVEPEEVVDAALVRAYDAFAKEHAPGDIRSRLVRYALDEIQAQVKRAQTDRTRAVHLEEDIPETPPQEEVSTLGEEILYFYQPDEDLKMEDVVPDLEMPAPDQVAEIEEVRSCVRTALRQLPEAARQALTLRYIVGLKGRELASGLGKSEAEAQELIENARASLRDSLTAAGCAVRR
jgi:ribosomal subunit interface protein